MPERGAALIAGNARPSKTAATDIVDETAQFIAQFEGLRLKPYFDSVGIPTIGYGHQLSPIKHAGWESWLPKKQTDTLNAAVETWKIANPNLANLVDGSGKLRDAKTAWGLLRRDVEKTMGLMLVDLGPKVIDRMTRNQKVATASIFYNSAGVIGGAKKVFPNLLRILKDGQMPDGSIATAKQLAQEWGGGRATWFRPSEKDQSAGVVHADGAYSRGLHNRRLVELERFFGDVTGGGGPPSAGALSEWFNAEWKIMTAPADPGGKVGQRTKLNTKMLGRNDWNAGMANAGLTPHGHPVGESVKKARLIKPQPPVGEFVEKSRLIKPQPPVRKGASLLRDPDRRMARLA